MAKPNITMKIDVSKINKELLYKGAKGTYLDVALWDKPSEWGDGYITQSASKEMRDKGVTGSIIGNWKHFDAPKTTKPKPVDSSANKDEEKPLPF